MGFLSDVPLQAARRCARYVPFRGLLLGHVPLQAASAGAPYVPFFGFLTNVPLGRLCLAVYLSDEFALSLLPCEQKRLNMHLSIVSTSQGSPLPGFLGRSFSSVFFLGFS